MRLTRLEIKGFKSFANHTVINFNESITGVVGPNGSGKSNIVDAIRWVLGEQKTRELRTEKMDNVIFNGSEKRAKSGRAWVTLNFINDQGILPSEYNEIEISRTLYRTGESEYRLNNVKCRLKDIKDLFMDTGIGSNSYAIITLGMVDDILLDRENFRRTMMEQAAGIEKYRDRKRKTFRKLNRTEEDLERLLDLLEEIGKNMRSLRVQAGKARKYNSVKESYRLASLYAAKKAGLTREKVLQTINEKTNALKTKIQGLKTEKAQTEDQLEQVKLKVLRQEKHLNDNQKKLNEQLQHIRKIENEQQLIEERKNLIRRQLKEAEQTLEISGTRKERFRDRLSQLQRRLDKVVKESEEKKSQLEIMLAAREETASRVALLEKEIEQLQKSAQLNREEKNKLELKKALLSNKKLSGKEEKEKLENSLQELKVKLEELENPEKDLHKELEATNTAIEQLERQKQEKRSLVEELRNAIAANFKQQAQLQRKLSGLESEYSLVQNMIENLEGYPESVKMISKNKKLKGQIDLFSDILNVPEEYKQALEIYLTPYINAVVTRNRSVAMKSIDLLRDAQGGKIDILIGEESEDLSKQVKFKDLNAQPVLQVLDYDKKYSALIHSLFKNSFFVDKIPVDYEVPVGVILIEKTGERVVSRGRFRGGSIGLFEGKKIGRTKNLELLDKRMDKLKSKLETLQKEQSELEKNKSQTDPEQFRSQLNELYEQRQQLLSKISASSQRAQSIHKQLDTSRQSLEEIQSSIKETEEDLSLIVQQLARFGKEDHSEEALLKEKEGILNQEKNKLSKQSQEYNQQNILTIQSQNEQGMLDKEMTLLNEERTRFEEELSTASKKVSDWQRERKQLEEKSEVLRKQLEDLYEEKNKASSELNASEKNYYQDRDAIKSLEDQIRDKDKREKELQNELYETEKQQNQQAYLKKEIHNRLEIEFGPDIIKELDEIQAQQIDETQDYESQRDKLKNKLRSYGEINPLSIEAYEEVKKRYEDLESQHADIINAKESLMSTIDEIEEEANHRFSQTLAALKENFQEVFQSLFSDGDDCDIYLSDEEDPLNSAIKIVAKPKGKRPQSINQLSGGEKTLTATAFLFALYLLKPAPFCIFDEVDAPLDDNNVLKFNKIIKEFSRNSQFIIITHNKLTMTAMDVIYGITMGREGVSLVSGVDFRHLKDPVNPTTI